MSDDGRKRLQNRAERNSLVKHDLKARVGLQKREVTKTTDEKGRK